MVPWVRYGILILMIPDFCLHSYFDCFCLRDGGLVLFSPRRWGVITCLFHSFLIKVSLFIFDMLYES